MRFRLSLTIVIVLAGLSMSAQCWAGYSIGLALPKPSKPSDPQLARDVKRALELFSEQLEGPLGVELKEEFGVDPPEITFKTITCPARDVPCAGFREIRLRCGDRTYLFRAGSGRGESLRPTSDGSSDSYGQ